jgi:transposase InsO family protein
MDDGSRSGLAAGEAVVPGTQLREASARIRALIAQLHTWMGDYNEHHPHRGLRMQSPREYRRLQATA